MFDFIETLFQELIYIVSNSLFTLESKVQEFYWINRFLKKKIEVFGLSKGVLVLVGLIVLGMAGVAALFLSNPASSSGAAGLQQSPSKDNQILNQNNGDVQIVNIKAVAYGYDPKEVRVKAGVPVELRFSADQGAGCSRVLIIKELGVKLIARDESVQVATFTPSQGTFTYRCSMNMFRGTLIVE